jgi:hypothetical protein
MEAEATGYKSSLTKFRRTKQDIEDLRSAAREILRVDQPMTVRQVFYRMVSAGLIAKTENEYKNTVVRLLGEMRRSGYIPLGWIADNTRWVRRPRTFSSMEAALQLTRQTYRRALWNDQSVYVEIRLEKDALAGVLYDVTARWDVPLMVTRGYPSLTYLYDAAEAIAAEDRPAYLYYFGDFDPSGIDIPQKVEAGIREFAPDAEIFFKRIAVTTEQIDHWQLPTRPTKQTDSRAKNFEGESVEVDSIPPRALRELTEKVIEQHIDRYTLQQTKLAESAERHSLDLWLRNWRENGRHGEVQVQQ